MPPRVVLDTSFVVEALIGSQPLHRRCQEFLVRLAEAGAELFYSRLLEGELHETTGVGCIVTIDVGFAHVPESQLVLYVDASRVARCREIRGRS